MICFSLGNVSTTDWGILSRSETTFLGMSASLGGRVSHWVDGGVRADTHHWVALKSMNLGALKSSR